MVIGFVNLDSVDTLPLCILFEEPPGPGPKTALQIPFISQINHYKKCVTQIVQFFSYIQPTPACRLPSPSKGSPCAGCSPALQEVSGLRKQVAIESFAGIHQDVILE